MKNKITRFILLLAFICSSISVTYAQSVTEQQAEDALTGFLYKMEYWRKQKAASSLNSLYVTNQRLKDYIMLHNNEDFMLTAAFKKLRAAGMIIHTSSDSICRTFLWDVTTSGPMHYRNSMLEFRANTLTTGTLYEKGLIVSEIITMHTQYGQTVYLVLNEDQYQRQERSRGYTAHYVEDEYFESKRFFHIGLDSQSYAGYKYDLSSYKMPDVKTPPVSFSKDMGYLYVPIVKKNGVFLNDYLIYKYNGNGYFYERAGKK